VQFLGLDGEGSITAPAAIRDSSHGCLSQKNATECPRSAVGHSRRFERAPITSGLPQ
jgi:hypothetical protein